MKINKVHGLAACFLSMRRRMLQKLVCLLRAASKKRGLGAGKNGAAGITDALYGNFLTLMGVGQCQSAAQFYVVMPACRAAERDRPLLLLVHGRPQYLEAGLRNLFVPNCDGIEFVGDGRHQFLACRSTRGRRPCATNIVRLPMSWAARTTA